MDSRGPSLVAGKHRKEIPNIWTYLHQQMLCPGLQCFETVFPPRPIIYLDPDLFVLFFFHREDETFTGLVNSKHEKKASSLGLAYI